ncbi:hypothetical protein [Luteococcus sanguinis]|uniref:CPBP family intramembrane metalloprotease n=1 Tax=Luteococcus sanguinis TaxID=174038 RepID=A0ABW1WZU6_9ACTN
MTSQRLWWRTNHFGPLLIGLLALAVAQRWIPAALLAPQLRALDDTDVPTATFLSAAVGITIAYQVAEPVPVLWRLSTPRARWRGVVRVVGATALYLGVTAVVAPAWVMPAISVVLTVVAEALLLLPRIDHRIVWAVPAVHCALSALLGRQLFGQLSWWAWPADPTPAMAQVVALAVGTAVLGLLVHSRGA